MRQRNLLGFLRFWGGIVMRAPSLVVEAFKRLDLGLSVLALLGVTGASAYFRLVSWWIPLAALVVYGLMWSIYDTFDEVRATNQTLQRQLTTSRKRRARWTYLGDTMRRAKNSPAMIRGWKRCPRRQRNRYPSGAKESTA